MIADAEAMIKHGLFLACFDVENICQSNECVVLFVQGQARAAFLATGGLWRASPVDHDLRRAHNNAVLDIQRRIDAMSEPELTTLVNGMHEVCSSFRSRPQD